jgi:hypothetical protein
MEQKVVAFAEQLGVLVGTVQARAEGWLDRQALRREIVRIRDGAASLLSDVNQPGEPAPKPRARKPAAAPRRSRGLVDAPGKRHRTPQPPERLDKRMSKAGGKGGRRKGPRG